MKATGPAMSDIATRDRLPTLTGLRFWAALLVVVYHLSHQIGEIQPFTALTMYGRTGVTFFFVLSGFVLAWNYLDRPANFRVFAWRRFARLWPLVAVTGVLSIVAYAAIGHRVAPVAAASTFTFMQAWRQEWAQGANPAAWSLSDEAFFYVTFPPLLILAASARQRRRLWWVAGVVLVLGWASFILLAFPAWRLDYFPPGRWVQFLVGVLCAVAMRRGAAAPIRYWWAVGLVVAYHLALIPWSMIVPDSSPVGAYSGSQWWATPVFALLIMAAAASDQEGRWTGVTGTWSIRFGHWSYAWYLIHEVVIRLWVHWIGDVPTALSWAVLLVLTLAAAGALYRWIEHPAEKALRTRGPQPRPAPPATAPLL